MPLQAVVGGEHDVGGRVVGVGVHRVRAGRPREVGKRMSRALTPVIVVIPTTRTR